MNAGLAAVSGALIYDSWLIRSRRNSITLCYRKSRTTHPVVTAAVTVYVVAHLWGILPDELDAFAGFSFLLTKPLTRRLTQTP